MHILSHISYPYILFHGAALLLGINVPIEYTAVLLFFSIFPDMDYVVNFFKQVLFQKKKSVI